MIEFTQIELEVLLDDVQHMILHGGLSEEDDILLEKIEEKFRKELKNQYNINIPSYKTRWG